jgi:hypothetical protein
LTSICASALLAACSAAAGVLNQTAETIDGEMVSLERYRGEVLLIVNVASQCGNTPQYEELERSSRTYGRGHASRIEGVLAEPVSCRPEPE